LTGRRARVERATPEGDVWDRSARAAAAVERAVVRRDNADRDVADRRDSPASISSWSDAEQEFESVLAAVGESEHERRAELLVV